MVQVEATMSGRRECFIFLAVPIYILFYFIIYQIVCLSYKACYDVKIKYIIAFIRHVNKTIAKMSVLRP